MPTTGQLRKLAIVNDALANTANNLASEADLTAAADAVSFEWDRGSRAYDRELPLLLERHPWPFARATEALDKAHEDENPSNRFAHAYDWPYACLWLERVEMPGGVPIPYEIVGRYICANYDGEDDNAPVATFIQMPPPSEISNLFYEVLRQKVEVSILRSINEDYSEAKRRDDTCEAMLLPMIRNRTDQQTPARRGLRSSMLEKRRGSTLAPVPPAR